MVDPYAENLAENIIIYDVLDGRGVYLERHGNDSYVVRQVD